MAWGRRGRAVFRDPLRVRHWASTGEAGKTWPALKEVFLQTVKTIIMRCDPGHG